VRKLKKSPATVRQEKTTTTHPSAIVDLLDSQVDRGLPDTLPSECLYDLAVPEER
jgi:hypothetical protein